MPRSCEPGSSRSIHGQSRGGAVARMRRAPLMRRIVLPQGDARHRAADGQRDDLPCSKTTSLAVVVTYPELLYQTETCGQDIRDDSAVHHGRASGTCS